MVCTRVFSVEHKSGERILVLFWKADVSFGLWRVLHSFVISALLNTLPYSKYLTDAISDCLEFCTFSTMANLHVFISLRTSNMCLYVTGTCLENI